MNHCSTFLPSGSARLISYSTLEYNRIYKVLGLVIALLATGCSTGIDTKARNEQEVLGAPPEDLAQGYLAVKTSSDLLKKYVKAGAFGGSGASFMVKIRGEVVNKDNVNEQLSKLEKQFSVYEEAIEVRGYSDVAGTYKGEATKSCAKSNSVFAAAIQNQLVTAIEIRQDGIDAQLTIRLKQKDKEMSVGTSAAIAENAFAMVEPMNSDFYFMGEVKDRVIVLKPDVSVLKTWPGWARPPSRSDLEDCMVTLERL